MWSCTGCGAQNEYLEPRCRGCGAPRPAGEAPAKHCVRCGRRFPPRHAFCGACGVPLEPLPQAGATAGRRGLSLTGATFGALVASLLVPAAGVLGGVAKMRAGEPVLGIVMILLSCLGLGLWFHFFGDYLAYNRY